jgi:hypothetical protein
MDSEDNKKRYPKNVPGPFFVANNECITCMAPVHAAPDLMGFDEKVGHCYFKKQPSTPEELEQAARAVWVSCCQAVQYSGDDSEIKRMIDEYDRDGLIRKCPKQPWWKIW